MKCCGALLLVVLFLGLSSLVVEWDLLFCCIVLCCSSLGAVCWLISICSLSGHSLLLEWILLSRCGVQDCFSLGAEWGASFIHAVSSLAPLLLQCWAPSKFCGELQSSCIGGHVPLKLRLGLHSSFFCVWILSSSSSLMVMGGNVQGCFCLVSMCGWPNYLWHEAPL